MADTKFKKGVSGNPNGRPKGVKNKAISLTQLSEKIAKGDETALNKLRDIMVSSNSDTQALRAALAWLNLSMDVRKQLHKVAMDKANEKDKENPVHEFDEEDSTPIVSLVAINK